MNYERPVNNIARQHFKTSALIPLTITIFIYLNLLISPLVFAQQTNIPEIPEIKVNLVNGATNQAVSGVEITALERLSDGSQKWVARHTTDNQGVAFFQLEGLGEGRRYLLKALPYDAGSVLSKLISRPRDTTFFVGTVPALLINANTQQPIPGIELVAYKLDSEKELLWSKKGITDNTGIVNFDLDGLRNDEVYVVRAIKPFGEEKRYYSALIREEGPVTLEVAPDTDSRLDLESPVVSIISPEQNGVVDAGGFVLQGLAGDNTTLNHVEIQVRDPLLGLSKGTADYDQQSKRWQYTVDAASLSPGKTVTVLAKTWDNTNNTNTVSARYLVIQDSKPPAIQIVSHKKGDAVTLFGFTIEGHASDNVGVVDLRISIDDPLLGQTVERQPIQLLPGETQWAFSITGQQISPGEIITVSIEAIDNAGQQTIESLNLQVAANSTDFQVQPGNYDHGHLLSRISFGATVESLNTINKIGVQRFIDQQLNPESIDDSDFQKKIKGNKPKDKNELEWYAIQRMTYSPRQLQEVMTWFWDNHFNTDANKHDKIQYEIDENKAFRQHALGQFRDLLKASAKSPAMLIYLDSVANKKEEPNENYARELLELHTMGVDGGYEHKDLEALAKVFTGWQVDNNDNFYFNLNKHDTQDKLFLGHLIPGGGVDEGEAVLDILAVHPDTANFICTKLSQLFINDKPNSNIVERCAAKFVATKGDIGQVVRLILTSSEFVAPENIRAKIKTPLEFIVGLLRNLNASVEDPAVIRQALRKMGMPLFRNPVPTGWPEEGYHWINPNQLLQRINFTNQLLGNTRRESPDYVDLRALVIKNDQQSVKQILHFFTTLQLGGHLSELEENIATVSLNTPTSFNIDAEDAELRLRSVLGQVLSSPAYQYQ